MVNFKLDAFRRLSSVILVSILWLSVFSVGVYGAEGDEVIGVEFSKDIAGLTPSSPWYLFDTTFTGSSAEEYLHETGIEVQQGNIEAAQKAIDNFNKEIAVYKDRVGSANLEGVTLETLSSHEGVRELYDAQVDLLDYQLYINEIEETLDEQVESGEIEANEVEAAELVIESAEEAVADTGAEIEGARLEVIEEVEDNSGVSGFVAESEFEAGLVGEAEARFPEGDSRFSRISGTTSVNDLRDEITRLQGELADAEEAGDSGETTAVRQLLEMAWSHGTKCLNAPEEELGLTGFGHLNAAEQLVDNAERLLEGEVQVSELAEEGLPVEPPTLEELQAEAEEEKADAEKFIEGYEALKDKYTDDPEKLAAVEAGNVRALKAQELGKQLYDNGVMEKWTAELTEEGLTGRNLEEAIHEKWTDEWNRVYGEEYFPLGLYTPGEETEVVGMGRVYQNPDSGKIEGWYGGKQIGLEVGGGIVQDYAYTDSETGFDYSFGSTGYSYTTPAGVTYAVPYAIPEGEDSFAPANQFEAGDEKYTYSTEDGGEITYTSTGYYVTDAEGETVAEEAYDQQDRYVYLGPVDKAGFGGTLDIEPTGVVVTNSDGEATIWEATPELTAIETQDDGTEDKIVTYYDPVDGKVFSVDVAPHEDVQYKEGTTYEYYYGGETWTYDSEGKSWTSASGANIKISGAPAPVGLESQQEVRTSEGVWRYDSASDSWTSSSGVKVYPSPNMRYRPAEGGYYGARGEFYRASGDYAVTDSYSGNAWAYDSATGAWKSSQTGDVYNPKDGTVTRADGTVASPEDRRPGEGRNIAWGYYEDSSGTGNAYQYGGYGGHYTYDPARSTYSYVNPGNYYYGGFTPGDSQKDAYGNSWILGSDGTWSNQGGGIATVVGGVYSGVAGLAPVGTSVVGDDGKTYRVTSERGWVDAEGRAVAPPSVAGVQQPSSATGMYYSGGQGIGSTPSVPVGTAYSGSDGKTYTKSAAGDWVGSDGVTVGTPPGFSSGGYGYASGGYGYSGSGYSPGAGSYGYSYGCANGACGGGYYGGYSPEADAAAQAAGYSSAAAAAAAAAGGGYYGGGYGSNAYGSPTQYGGYASGSPYYSGGYAGGPGASYPGYSSSGSGAYGGGYDASGVYTGGQYGAYDSSGSFVGYGGSGDSYSGGTYSGTYSGDGSYSSGTYTGGDTSGTTSGSYSGGTTSGDTSGTTSSSTSGGDSGGTTSGGDSGGSTGGDGGGSTGGVVSETDKAPRSPLANFFCKLFRFCR